MLDESTLHDDKRLCDDFWLWNVDEFGSMRCQEKQAVNLRTLLAKCKPEYDRKIG